MEEQASLVAAYNLIPHELSGARSKNRFRLELYWGISKMFDLLHNPDFCIVFDYKCDIEVHLSRTLEFYQVKTHKIQKPYNFTTISKQDRDTGKSILGQLYLLKCYSGSEVEIKVAIVSNAFLKLNDRTYADKEEILFSELDEKARKTIINKLKNEISESSIDLSKISYIYTSMDLLKPEDAVCGKITKTFEEIKGKEPVKPNALCRLIIDTVREKACYELALNSYEDVIKNKGITKNELNMLMDRHDEKSDICVEKTITYIDGLNVGIREKKKLKSALINICGELITSKELISKELEISAYLTSQSELPDSFEDVIKLLLSEFERKFPIEFSEEQIYVLMVLIAKRWEDNYYE